VAELHLDVDLDVALQPATHQRCQLAASHLACEDIRYSVLLTMPRIALQVFDPLIRPMSGAAAATPTLTPARTRTRTRTSAAAASSCSSCATAPSCGGSSGSTTSARLQRHEVLERILPYDNVCSHLHHIGYSTAAAAATATADRGYS
jgi:hypothetical protein